MSSLSQLLAFFERVPADELRLTSGESPYVVSEGQRRPVGSQPMNARLLHAAASEILNKDELEQLTADRPRVVRHEHQGATWHIEVTRVSSGVAMTVRRGRSVVTRLDRRVDLDVVREAVGAGSMRNEVVRAIPETLAPGRPELKRVPESSKKREESSQNHIAVRPASLVSVHEVSSIESLLQQMVATGASDLHISAGNRPALRVHGDIRFLNERPVLTGAEVEALLRAIMPERIAAAFEETRDVDFAYELSQIARFRVNVFEDREGVCAVVRQVHLDVPTVEDLLLPKACVDLCQLTRGLVLVTGPTGAGKSTTIAAMIDHINKTRSDHVVTIEDPVEFVHSNRKSLVNQREVGHHTKSYSSALRSVLREDPDVVMIGELRDLETITLALETAETGHLVFATLHTMTAVSAVDRIIDQFPGDKQQQARVMVSRAMKGVIAQTLCKKTGGGRVAAHEILLSTPAVAALIREGKTYQMPGIMQVSRGLGMITLNESLFSLVQRRTISPKEAWIRAVDKLGFVAMLESAGMAAPFG